MPFSISQANLFPAFHAGYCIGLQGGALTPVPAVPPSQGIVPSEWDAFVKDVRSSAIVFRGKRNEGWEACAEAFVAGALETFPEAGEKIFLRTLGRVWGAKMSPSKNRLPLPVDGARLSFSTAVGRHGGEKLRADYEAGRAAGLGQTVLDAKLHLRGMDDYLRSGGWYLGTALFLKDRFPERSGLLSRNYASVLHRAFHSGRRSYPEDAVEYLPSMIQSLDLEIERLACTDNEVAEALRSNRDSILNRALHSGNLKYPGEAVEAIPGMLKTLEGHATLRSNRATIVSRALNRGNFDYPEEAAKHLSELFAVLDREIERLNPHVSKTARILEANRATIVMRALADGGFDYPAEAVKKLPKLRRKLESEIKLLADKDPEAAQVLKDHGLSVIACALNRADWDYPQKVARALPAFIEGLPPTMRAAAVHDALLKRKI